MAPAGGERQWLFSYLEQTFGTSPEYLWLRTPNYAVFRRPDNGRWYAAVVDIPKSKLGLPDDTVADVLLLKCDPRMLGSLLENEGFYPAYHMNKSNWVAVLLDGTVPRQAMTGLLHVAYTLTAGAGKRRRKDL